MRRVAFISCLGLWVALAPSDAIAGEVACTDLPNPVIGVGGSASVPLMAAIGPALAGASEPLTVIYQSPGACFGITTFVDDAPVTGTASYWDAKGSQLTCSFPVTGIIPDYGMLGVQGTLCEGVEEIPEGIGTFQGPVTGWTLLVPNASSQTSISAEAVYFVYGFGAAAGMVSPWTNDTELYSRDPTSAALIAIGLGANVPATKMKGIDVMSNGNMISSLAMSTNPENAIGYTSAEVADANRDSVRILAYQAYDQTCAYWPDSTSTAFDKQNVRDGHYYLWSPYNFYAPVDGAGNIEDPETARFIGFFTGDEPLPPELPLLDIIIDNGNIPECAMQVWRDEEVGPLYSYQHEEPCTCYYEFRATGATDCGECETNDQCPAEAPTCRYGYCEVQ